MSILAGSRLRANESILAAPFWKKWRTDGESFRMPRRRGFRPMGSDEDRQGWIFGSGIILFLGVAVGFSYPVAGCHRVPPLTPQEAEGKHSLLCAMRALPRRQRPGSEEGPARFASMYSRGHVFPSGAPATDPEVKRVVLSGKGMMPSFAGRFTDEADGCAYRVPAYGAALEAG